LKFIKQLLLSNNPGYIEIETAPVEIVKAKRTRRKAS
jgi:hypothetical protein